MALKKFMSVRVCRGVNERTLHDSSYKLQCAGGENDYSLSYTKNT